MTFLKNSADGVFAYYWDPHFGLFSETDPHVRYQIERLPAPPPDVMAEAIAFSRGRRRFGVSAPPPPRWREALNKLVELRGYFPAS